VGLKQALYHLQIIKLSGAYKLVEGIATQISMPPEGKVTIEMDN
jgi:hypothetical protein